MRGVKGYRLEYEKGSCGIRPQDFNPSEKTGENSEI